MNKKNSMWMSKSQKNITGKRASHRIDIVWKHAKPVTH